MYRSVEYPLLCTKEQLQLLEQCAGNSRWLYNYMLSQRMEAYKADTKVPSAFDQNKQLPALKKEHGWLALSEGLSLQQTILNLQTAFKRFFDGVSGFPQFKKKGSFDSFRIPNSNVEKGCDTVWIWQPEDDIGKCQIKLAKLGWFKIIHHREIPESWLIKSVTVKKRSNGRWYAIVLCDTQTEALKSIPIERAIENSVGIDFGLKSFLTLSNGNVVESPKHYHRMERRLKIRQRKLSRKAKGSANRQRAKQCLSKSHYKVAQQRKSFLHTLSSQISSQFDLVTLETLNIAGMAKNHCLAKSVMTSGWSMFKTFLSYKMEAKGNHLVFADRWFASSRISYETGEKNDSLKLSDRHWIDSAGNKLDRDVNAAKNLNYVGQHLLSTGELLSTETYQALYG